MDIISGLIAAASALGSALASIPAWVGVLINIGMSLLGMLMQKKQDKPNDPQQVLRQEMPVRQYYLGRGPIGGYIILLEVYNGRIYVLQYYTEGTADYTGADLYIDQKLAAFGEDGWATNKPIKGKVYFDKRSGTVPGVPYDILLEDMSAYITKNFRGDGMCTGLIVGKSVGKKQVSDVYPVGITSSKVIANWNTVYDPRTKTTGFSRNLALHALHYLRHPDGCGYSDDDIDIDGTWTHAAAVANQKLITRDGSSIRRYEGFTGWKLDEKRGDVMRRLVAGMDARFFLTTEGKIGIYIGEWIEPTVHIPDDMIINAEIREGPTEDERCREVVIQWTNPAAQYTPTTTRPWIVDDVTQTERKQYQILEIQNNNHGRRIAKIIADKLNPAYKGWIEGPLYLMKAWKKRFITISYSDLNIVNHAVEIEKIGLNRETMTVRIDFRTARKSRYDFDAATEEGDPIIVPEPIGEKDPVLPSEITVLATISSAGASLTMNCATPKRPGEHKSDPATIETEWLWSIANAEEWHTLGRSEATAAYVSGIQSAGPFDVKVRHIGANSVASDDVVVEDITPQETRAKPPAPTKVKVAKATSAVGTAAVTFTTPVDPKRFAGIEIWRGKSGDSDTAVLVDTAYRSTAGVYTVEDEAGAGTWYYYASSVTWGGTRSGRVAASNNPITL